MNEKQPAPFRNGLDLDKYLSPIDVWAIAFGCIVGWGAFVMPGTTFLPVAGPLGTVIAMSIGTAIMLIIGRNYSYLMEHSPGTGGVYSYTKEAFGRDHAFLCAWFLSLSYLTIVFLNATALFVVSRIFFGSMLQFGFHYNIAGYDIYISEIALSALALVIIGLLFILKKPLLQGVQTALAIILLVGVTVIAAAIIPQLKNLEVYGSFAKGGFKNATTGIMTVVLLTPWAFVGFDVASLETAHFKFPIKKSKRIVTLSIIFSGLVYIALALVSAALVPEKYASWQEYMADLSNISGISAVPVFYAGHEVMGKAGLVLMGITALAAILTGIICAYRATTRVLSTMAEDKILSRKFLGTTYCIIFIMLISIFVSFLGRNALNWFVELTSFGAVIGFGYTSAAAYKTATKYNNRHIRITGAAGAAISCIFAFVHLISKVASIETMGAQSFFLLALWCLVGFMFYWRTMRQSDLSEYHSANTSASVLFCLLFYSALIWFTKTLLAVGSTEPMRSVIIRSSALMLILVFVGLAVTMYIQGTLQDRHDKLQRAKIHAEESNKAKSQFLFNMSHDIRTPMTAILGCAHLAQQEDNVPPKLQEYLKKIDVSGKHLLTLINDVLEMSQIESGKLELNNINADICETASTAFDMFETQMSEKGISCELDMSEVKSSAAVFDRTRMLRVILNLLSNAYKFTPEGGHISLTIRQLAAQTEDTVNYEIRVKDTGIGMTKEFSETVFEAFARERTSTVSGTPGTGLGMAITKNIIDSMNGTIKVETAPNIGTEFIINVSFPISKEMISTDRKPIEADIDFSKVRLLLVEDNEINRRLAQMILSQFGCNVDTAKDGKQAVEILSSSAPFTYDAVLMDIQMPVMDGYAATKVIRELEDKSISDIPIIAMTANAFSADIQAAEKAGMQAHISKPLDVEKMLSTLSAVLSAAQDKSARTYKA